MFKPYVRAKPGFTIIELLTVIGIMLFLMAVVAGVSINANKNSKIRATKALIQRIGIGLTQYYGELRDYPPDVGFGMPIGSSVSGNDVRYDSGSLWRYLGQEVVQRDKNGAILRTFGPYIQFKDGELNAYDDPKYGKSSYVVDAWKTPLGYRGDPRRVIYDRGNVDLFSAGPNKVTASTDDADNGASGSNSAYDGMDSNGDSIEDNAPELGEAALDGCLTGTKKKKTEREVLDDINSWDPN